MKMLTAFTDNDNSKVETPSSSSLILILVHSPNIYSPLAFFMFHLIFTAYKATIGEKVMS